MDCSFLTKTSINTIHLIEINLDQKQTLVFSQYT
ncbi:MAG: hypothetical protein ACI8VJ_000129 [Polaribacter sp.]|jgi:hypothetical protein